MDSEYREPLTIEAKATPPHMPVAGFKRPHVLKYRICEIGEIRSPLPGRAALSGQMEFDFPDIAKGFNHVFFQLGDQLFFRDPDRFA